MIKSLRKFFAGMVAALLIAVMVIPFAFTLKTHAAAAYDPTSKEFDAPTGAIKPTASTNIVMPKILPSLPYTFEAEILLNTTNRGGVIVGNYGKNVNGDSSALSFEIYQNGKPRLFVQSKSGNQQSVIFDKVNVAINEYVRLAITVDEENGMAHCYVNGVLMQSESFSYTNYLSEVSQFPLRIGGDHRNGNDQYFKGNIKSVALYSDMRSQEEISSGLNLNDAALMVAYDFSNVGIKNLSKLEGLDLITNDVSLYGQGLSFTHENSYKVMKPFDSQILTYEAMVLIPTSTPDNTRVGVLFGNYSASTYSTNFEFKYSASPRLYFEGPNGTLFDFHFENVDARSDDWTFVTITLDPSTGTAKCYINGELKGTITKGPISIPDSVYDREFYLGRDTRSSNNSPLPFRGLVKSLAVYSDTRTEEEIRADMLAFDKESDNVLAIYELAEETGRSDISGNCYHICYVGETKPEDTSEPSNPSDPDTPSAPAVPDEISGLEFSGSDYAIVQNGIPLDTRYITLEAFIQLSPSVSSRGGVILGNYKDNSNHYFNFEIYDHGIPRVSGTLPNNLSARYDYQFDLVDVRDNKPVHLAITVDTQTGVASCYLNGVWKQSITQQSFTFPSTLNDLRLVLGNDLRPNDKKPFLGTIGSVAVFDDIRTAEEIAADCISVDTESDNLLLCYDLSGATKGEDISDLSGNGYNIKFQTSGHAEVSKWISEKDAVTDYLYSFVLVGDTQIIAQYHSDDFGKIYDWILANKDSKKIGYVFGLGDITNSSTEGEWSLARTHILGKLTGVIPYSVVRGNHDTVNHFNNVFATSAYMSQFDGFYDSSVANSYRFFEIEGTEYLLFTLDYGASDDVLNWAGEIISANPEKRVIITTHAYLYRDGSTLDQNDVCPPATTGGYNNGDHIWDKLASKYENVYLVVSGHDPCENVVVSQREGVHGNIVTEMLVDPQGVDTSIPTGMITMLYFKADGSIEVETYSTIQELYYKETNQFTIKETAHSFTKNESCVYPNGYLAAGVHSATCIYCKKVKDSATDAIIVFKGYSIKNDETALCAGYSINYRALNLYERINNQKLVLGAVACASGNLANGDNKPINADGSTASVIAGKILSSPIDTSYPNVLVIMETDNWSKYENSEVILCLYIIDGNTVSYACDKSSASESAIAITYNQIRNLTTLKGDDEE